MPKMASIGLLGFMMLCLLVVGCAPRQFFYLDPRFHELELGRICILPIIDRRIDRSPDIDLNAAMQERIYKKVKKKGYDVSTASTFSATGDVTADAVALMSQQEVSNLGPADATTLLMVYVRRANGSYEVMRYRFWVSAEVELIHKPTRTMLWKAYGKGFVQKKGLISGILVPLARFHAFRKCVNNMMEGLPDKPSTTYRRPNEDQVVEEDEGAGENEIVKQKPSPSPSTTPPSPPSPPSQPQESTENTRDERGIININTEPPGAKVFIDGEYKGQTPAEISLTTGTYQLFLEHQLYEPYKDSVMIEKGQNKSLNIKLSPEGEE